MFEFMKNALFLTAGLTGLLISTILIVAIIETVKRAIGGKKK